ncbi:hypothetical protein RD055328_08170 [Companilactobacillus sp. RD055328]|uniref:LysM peptidoglycan-binding domain-containing protein n=1 Tax=Companilactobacillus sp. RD055328 TaxID=2916634 RepID=UPI001FC8CFE2|nr:LysM domain-containing protein [Companilactobacillus sp. RD055328]GKQ42894.1 hypothetical protein RD055328_08170 [Companilactobacillus sp. RD055328]
MLSGKEYKNYALATATILGMGTGLAMLSNPNHVEAATWSARSTSAIQSSMKTNGTKPYTIVWGDTLSTIVEAATNNGINTNMTRLAEINKISNIDLIYSGNKIWFSGTGDNGTLTTTDKNGNNKSYNLSPNKPVVKDNSQSSSNNNNNGSTTKPATPNNPGNGNDDTGNNSDNNKDWAYYLNSQTLMSKFFGLINLNNYGIQIGAPADKENWESITQGFGFSGPLDDGVLSEKYPWTDDSIAQFTYEESFSNGILNGMTADYANDLNINLNDNKYKYVTVNFDQADGSFVADNYKGSGISAELTWYYQDPSTQATK